MHVAVQQLNTDLASLLLSCAASKCQPSADIVSQPIRAVNAEGQSPLDTIAIPWRQLELSTKDFQ
jgi:hypothetical protein